MGKLTFGGWAAISAGLFLFGSAAAQTDPFAALYVPSSRAKPPAATPPPRPAPKPPAQAAPDNSAIGDLLRGVETPADSSPEPAVIVITYVGDTRAVGTVRRVTASEQADEISLPQVDVISFNIQNEGGRLNVSNRRTSVKFLCGLSSEHGGTGIFGIIKAEPVAKDNIPAFDMACQNKPLQGKEFRSVADASAYVTPLLKSRAASSLSKTKSRVAAGDVGATYALGGIYEDGAIVPKDKAEALRLYRLAAGKGSTGAMKRLGQAYQKGQLGLVANRDEALRWYKMAQAKGDKEAASEVARLTAPPPKPILQSIGESFMTSCHWSETLGQYENAWGGAC